MITQWLSHPGLRLRMVLVACIALGWLPLAGLPLWRYAYGFVGDLTPGTWVLFFVWMGFPEVFRHWVHNELSFRRRLRLFLGMALFYVLALGSWNFDPYLYGYQPWPVLAALVAWVAWRGRFAPGLTLLLGLDLAFYGLHTLTSDNLWDYLLDPLLMIGLGISVIRGLMSRRFN